MIRSPVPTRSTNMENMEKSENERTDFETDIDTWVIDKEDSNTSIGIEKSQSSETKSMNKENIKQFNDCSDKKSLRCFRIRKHIAYQDQSSESDSESKRKYSSDQDDCKLWNKKIKSEPCDIEDSTLWNIKIKSEPSDSSKVKTEPKSKPNYVAPTSSLIDNRKENVSLNSDEISVILSEIDDNSESNQELRERLHSIENVSNVSDSKEKNNESPSLKLTYTCHICNLDYQTLDDFQIHTSTHKKSSLSPPSQQIVDSPLTQLNQDKSREKPPSILNSSVNKSDFLDTFKTHLLKNGIIKPKRPVENIKPHVRTFRNGKCAFKCSICNFYTAKLLKFKVHEILFHSDIKNLNCEYCDFKTSICVNLATHIKEHIQDCPHCEYQCLRATELSTHLAKYHFAYECSKCDFRSDSRTKFNWHLKTNHRIKEFKCDHCKSVFKLKPQLTAHIKKHCVQEKKFKCDDCEMCFSNKDSLAYHRKSHRDFYVCDICKSKFARKNFLILHLKVHNKPTFKCNKCDSVFPGKRLLRLHMRSHQPTGFKCEHCRFESTNSIDISKHICLNKLSEIEKVTLNFLTGDYENVNLINATLIDDTCNNEERNLRNSESQENIRRTRSGTEKKTKTTNSKSENISQHKNEKDKKSKLKSLSLRQNLPSRSNHKNFYKAERINSSLKNSTNTCSKIKGVVSKKIGIKKNPVSKMRVHDVQNSELVKENECVKDKTTDHHVKKLAKKKRYMLKDLDCMQVIFGRKTYLSNLLVDPVRFIGESYVQCYYQHQPTTTAPLEHVERHLRQRSLLSCPLCRYKTNSQQLLQRHTEESHTWDPAVVNTLFS